MNKLYTIAFLICSLGFMGCGEDDEPTGNVFPSLSASDIEVAEGDSNKKINISIELSEAVAVNSFISYSTADQSAVSGLDFASASGTLEFLPGESQKEIEITILGDVFKEDTETFQLVFSSAINLSIATKEITITITDTDTEEDSGEFTDSGYTTPTEYDGYTLVWQDEFEGTSLSSDWTPEIGTGSNGWGNNELQYYRAENATVNDGYLTITAKRENFGGRQYTSSRLITQNNQSFKYGRIDIRAMLPRGQGLWPALWMLGSNFSSVGWPRCGEIDIMEMIGGSGRENDVFGTLHWYDDTAQDRACTCGQGHYTLSNGTFADEFHVFTLKWDAQSIKWYVNDELYNTISITPANLSEFQEEFFFIFNVAVGGELPGSPNANTTFPQRMIVDYVRVFQTQ